MPQYKDVYTVLLRYTLVFIVCGKRKREVVLFLDVFKLEQTKTKLST